MPQQLLAAPQLQVDAPLAFAIGQSLTHLTLSWSRIETASQYHVRVLRREADQYLPVREQFPNDVSVCLEALSEGLYQATVDAEKLESTESRPVTFRIVGTQIPPGSIVSDGVIQLPPNERVMLLQAQGREIGYGVSATAFVAAPPSLSLNGEAKVLLRLRERGARREVRLQLLPLDVTPAIELGSARATWPGEPVRVSIVARHRNGRPEVIAATVQPMVTINNQPVKVLWQ